MTLCLGVPGKVVAVMENQPWAVVEALGVKMKVGIHLLEQVEPGDYIMVHAGFAIEKIELEEALTSIKLWEEMLTNESVELLP